MRRSLGRLAMMFPALIVMCMMALPAEAAKEPPVKFSPTKLMTTSQTSAQAWVRNNTGKNITVWRTLNGSAVKSVTVRPGLHRIDLPSIGRGESAQAGLSAKVGGRLFSYATYITRPSLLLVDRSLETKTQADKKVLVAVESDKKVTALTNAVVHARDGREAKCLAKDFDMGFEFSPMCELTVPGDFIPNQVSMVFFTGRLPSQKDGTVGVKLGQVE